jgi:hypothetical protein
MTEHSKALAVALPPLRWTEKVLIREALENEAERLADIFNDEYEASYYDDDDLATMRVKAAQCATLADRFRPAADDVVEESSLLAKTTIETVAVVLEGGVVQDVFCKDGTPLRVIVIDYDCNDESEGRQTPQDDSDTALARVAHWGARKAGSAEFWKAIAP